MPSTTHPADCHLAYIDLLKKVYPAIKAADPTATVVIGGLMAAIEPQFIWETGSGTTWLERFLAAGGGAYIDLMNIHAYNGTGSGTEVRIKDRFSIVRSAMSSHGIGSMPIWNTETNYNLGNPEQQRQSAARNLVESLVGGAAKVFFFEGVDYADGEVSQPWGLFTSKGQPRPGFFSYLTATRMLAGLTTITTTTIGGVEAFRFTDGVRTVTVLWNDAGATVSVPVGATAYDDFGNVLVGTTVTLGPTATYLVQ
jgi:hypothetical protein